MAALVVVVVEDGWEVMDGLSAALSLHAAADVPEELKMNCSLLVSATLPFVAF